jgi:hypothetical protein
MIPVTGGHYSEISETAVMVPLMTEEIFGRCLGSRFHNLILPSCYKAPSRTVLVVFPHTAPRGKFTLISAQTVER